MYENTPTQSEALKMLDGYKSLTERQSSEKYQLSQDLLQLRTRVKELARLNRNLTDWLAISAAANAIFAVTVLYVVLQ